MNVILQDSHCITLNKAEQDGCHCTDVTDYKSILHSWNLGT